MIRCKKKTLYNNCLNIIVMTLNITGAKTKKDKLTECVFITLHHLKCSLALPAFRSHMHTVHEQLTLVVSHFRKVILS